MGKALSNTMERVVALEQTQSLLAREFRKLQDNCMDLENCSWRQKLRLIGVKEGAEAGNWTKFSAAFFPVVLRESHFDGPAITHHAHRMLGPKPKRGDRPSAIIVHLHYFSDRKKILGLSRLKGYLTYRGSTVHIFPDMSPEVSKLEAAFNPVKVKLWEAKIDYSLYYPAELTLTINRIGYSFDTPRQPRNSSTRRLHPQHGRR